MQEEFVHFLLGKPWRRKKRANTMLAVFSGVFCALALPSCGIKSIKRADSSYVRMSNADAMQTLANGPIHIDANNLSPVLGYRRVRQPTGGNTYIEHTVRYCNTNPDRDKILTVKNVDASGITFYSWEYTGAGFNAANDGCTFDVAIVPRFVAFDSITKIDVDQNHSIQSYPDEVIALFSHGEPVARFLVAKQEKGQERAYISALLVLCHNIR
jgi:hypothetical protein